MALENDTTTVSYGNQVGEGSTGGVIERCYPPGNFAVLGALFA